MELSSFFECVSENFILGHADKEKLEAAFDGAYSDVEFHAGDVILSPEKKQRVVGLVLKGTATAEPCGGSDNALLRLLCAGDMFGIANLYAENEPFPSIIKAKTVAHILFLDAGRFKWLIETDGNALRAYLSFMSKKIVYLNKKISTLTAGSAEKKLALYLCENSRDGSFLADVPMSALAELLGVGRASLYRAMDTLERSGAITKNGKTIIINDINALLNI